VVVATGRLQAARCHNHARRETGARLNEIYYRMSDPCAAAAGGDP